MYAQRDRIFRIVVLSLFVLSLGACNLPNRTPAATEDKNAVATHVAQTVQAALPTKPSATSTFQAFLQSTNTSLPPTSPATEIPVTPTLASTATSALPTITSTADTNCRYGPDKVYPALGFLLVGQQSTVNGRNDSSTWWYIENPAKPGSYCWVWAQTTRVNGDTTRLPVIAAPPTPTPLPGPEVILYFSNMHNCGGNPTLVFQVVNNSADRIRSVSLEIEDNDSGDTLFGPDVANQPFMASPGDCPPGSAALTPGEVGYIGAEIDFPAPSGDTGQAFITLCTDKDMNGACVDLKIKFEIP